MAQVNTTAAFSNPFPKGTGDWKIDKEIMRKAERGIALEAPTAAKQKAYADYQNYLRKEIQRKAENNQLLENSTSWKDALYNQYSQAHQTKNYMSELTKSYDDALASQLAQMKASNDRATGELNQNKANLSSEYAGKRNQADVVSEQNMSKLREVMAANGLSSSGENVTSQVALGSARQGALNQLNTQEQQEVNDINRRISDINNPERENALRSQFASEKSRALADAMQNNRNLSYQQYRDGVSDSRYNQQWEYQKGQDKQQWDYQVGRDKISDKRYDQEFDYRKRQDLIAQQERDRAFKNMTEQQKLQFAWDKQKYGEDRAWQLYQMEYQGNLQSSMNQAQIDLYNGLGLGSFLE